MARILTGVQSTGTPHLGNILGAIIPAIEMSNDPKNDSYLFIADMHSLTQIKDANNCDKTPMPRPLLGWRLAWTSKKQSFTDKAMYRKSRSCLGI